MVKAQMTNFKTQMSNESTMPKSKRFDIGALDLI
jgi:hypothetical protein